MSTSVGEMIYLYEATMIDHATLQPVTYLFSSGVGYNDPSGPGAYVPALKAPVASIQRMAFALGQTYNNGQSQPFSQGPVTINNIAEDLSTAGPFDFLLDQGADGQLGRLLLIDPTQVYSTAIPVLSNTQEQLMDNGDGTMSFAFRDQTLSLDQPFQPNVFAGTNVGGTGVEGTANDLKNLPYPYGFGQISNASPAPANSVNFVFQLSYRQVSSIQNVYDKGSTLTAGIAQASLAALLAGTPAASHFDYYLGSATDGAYIKCGTRPVGAITVDFHGDATGAGYITTVADVWKRILLMAIPGATVSAGDVTALNAALPAIVQYYVNSAKTFRQVLDEIVAGAGCFYYLDSLGTWHIKQLLDPAAGTAVCNVYPFIPTISATAATDCDILSVKREKPADPQSTDPNNGVPVWYVNVNWGKNWTVQAPGELDGASTARASFTSQEFRSVVAQDSGTSTTSLTVGLGAQTLTCVEAQAVWTAGQLISVHDSGKTKVMVGTVTSYTGTTLVMNVTSIIGSGTAAAWIIDGTKALHLLARSLTFNYLFAVAADAAAEAQRLLGLYRVRRDFITVQINLSAGVGSSIDLGSIVNLKLGRWGYSGGKKMLVTGIIYDAAANLMTLHLWG